MLPDITLRVKNKDMKRPALPATNANEIDSKAPALQGKLSGLGQAAPNGDVDMLL